MALAFAVQRVSQKSDVVAAALAPPHTPVCPGGDFSGVGARPGHCGKGSRNARRWQPGDRDAAAVVAVAAVAALAQARRSAGGRRGWCQQRGHRIHRCSSGDVTFSASSLRLTQLGGSATDKALQVNLDTTLYGSFAEIGAGQEVSRTFLTAGAAAGTVARSLSAYDMQLSDVTYGKAARYVTLERLKQMLDTEYNTLEDTIRDTKGPDTRFFAFASTLAAKAYMSDRECDGWVGMTYQGEPGAPKSTVALHVRMRDPTAQLQGEAIGILGTNLVYLCNSTNDPYLIATNLLDGIEGDSRLEIDYAEFSGPCFPAGSVDTRLLAMRMVQFRVAVSVMLDYNKESGIYEMVVPNNALYKRSVAVQRSRFRPVTFSHREIIDSAHRQLQAELEDGAKSPLQILNLQIDDIVREKALIKTKTRMGVAAKLVEGDIDEDGYVTKEELYKIVEGKLDIAQVEQALKELDMRGSGKFSIDALTGLARDSVLVTEYLDRFNMLESLRFPVLVSGIRRTHNLARYFSRYTREKIVVVIGGGDYDIERDLFNEKVYKSNEGGMLEGFGRLRDNVRIFQYPNISGDGEVSEGKIASGVVGYLHKYLIEKGKIVQVEKEYISPQVLEKESNEAFRGNSDDVTSMFLAGDAAWEKYVPPEVAAIVKKRSWFKDLAKGNPIPAMVQTLVRAMA